MAYYKQLVGDICYLSPLSTEDAEKYCEFLNDLSITINLDATFTLTPENERQAIVNLQGGNNKVFGIIEKEADLLIGGVGLHDINHLNRSAMFGIYIGDSTYQGKGYGKEATLLILDYGFNILNLNSIFLMVYEFNNKAIKCYEKCGFRLTGRKRQAKIYGDKKYDVLIMDILAEEYKSIFIKKLFPENK